MASTQSQKKSYPDGWTTMDEQKFLKWYTDWARRTRVNPNPDDPRHYYDYRSAFNSNVAPNYNPQDGSFHWPSSFKSENHPNRFVDTGGQMIDTITGRPARQEDYDKWQELRRKSVGDAFKNSSNWAR